MTSFATMPGVTSAAGLVTALGALPVFSRARVTHRTHDAALGLVTGAMVATSVFGLVIPGLEEGTFPEVMAGVLVGGLVLLGGSYLIPHIHAQYRERFPEGGATEADAAAMGFPAADPVDVAGGSADTAGTPASDDVVGSAAGDASDPAANDEGENADGMEASLRKALLIGGRSPSTTRPRGWRSASRSPPG